MVELKSGPEVSKRGRKVVNGEIEIRRDDEVGEGRREVVEGLAECRADGEMSERGQVVDGVVEFTAENEVGEREGEEKITSHSRHCQVGESVRQNWGIRLGEGEVGEIG